VSGATGGAPRAASGAPGLAARLREGTRELHRAAERSGIMREILVGRSVPPAGYARLLRSLHAIYAALEAGLVRHAAHPAVAPVHFPELARAERLAGDLAVHAGPDWAALAPAPAADDYAARVRDLIERDPPLLVAHAYVRYLGDLSGGQHMPGLIAAAAGVRPDAGFAFYDFSALGDLAAFKTRYRAALDALPLAEADARRVVAEAESAFARHVRMFEELAAPA
jgi:heme oxygenase